MRFTGLGYAFYSCLQLLDTCLKIKYKITSNCRLDYELLKRDARTLGRVLCYIFRKHKFLSSIFRNPPQKVMSYSSWNPGRNYGILTISIKKNVMMFSRTILIPYQEFIFFFLPPSVPLSVSL